MTQNPYPLCRSYQEKICSIKTVVQMYASIKKVTCIYCILKGQSCYKYKANKLQCTFWKVALHFCNNKSQSNFQVAQYTQNHFVSYCVDNQHYSEKSIQVLVCNTELLVQKEYWPVERSSQCTCTCSWRADEISPTA